MDYSEQLTKMRDDMHRSIVQEAVVKTFDRHNGDKSELLLRVPLATDKNNIYVIGVNCNTGDLISENENGTRNTLMYRHLSVEELSILYKAVVEVKDYKIKLLYDEKN